MNSKEKKLLRNLEETNCVSIKFFLISYCGFYEESLLDSKIAHDHIKYLFPNLKRISYDKMFASIKDVYTGEIILVKDCFGNVAPYLKPVIKGYTGENYITCTPKMVKEEKLEKAIELENLSLYQLVELGRKYRQQNRINDYRKVCRMIQRYNRESGIELYHKRKEKSLLKRREEYDKY